MQTKTSRRYILTVSCPDAVGLVAAVSSLIADWDHVIVHENRTVVLV